MTNKEKSHWGDRIAEKRKLRPARRNGPAEEEKMRYAGVAAYRLLYKALANSSAKAL